MTIPYARALWSRLETLHAVTYFAEECRQANRDVGLRGFWMGYVASRAAPLGAVGPAVATAVFANFHPAFIARSLPGAWSYATPDTVLDARRSAAATALRRLAPGIADVAARALPLLERAIATASLAGRPLFAANRELGLPDDPVEALWQAATCLREHRGDGHVASSTAAGLDGLAAHVLFAASEGVPADLLRDNRGWSVGEWNAAAARLEAEGLITGASATAEGRDLRADVEIRTDRAAATAYAELSEPERTRLLGTLGPAAVAVATSGVLPYPNPMGLPAVT